MRRIKSLLGVGLVALMTAGTVGVSVAPAAATPTICSTWKSGKTAYSLCEGGTGAQRVIAACRWSALTGSGTRYYYGPYVAKGQISQATCPKSNEVLAYVGINKPGG